MQPEQLVAVHPTLYHMAEADAWDAIVQHGLLSTSRLLDLFKVEGSARQAIESARRPDSVAITSPEYGAAVIRDNKPLSDRRLAACLSGMTLSEYYELLNSRVFFWPTRQRLEALLSARAYRERAHLVISVDTKRLLERQGDQVSLSPINSGAVMFEAPRRGPETFLSVADFDFDGWRRRRSRLKAIAEVAVSSGVESILEVGNKAEIAAPDGERRHIWKRP